MAPAAGLFRRASLWGIDESAPKGQRVIAGTEGFRPRIVIGPGCIALERSDQARADRAREREARRVEIDVDLMVSVLLAGEELPDDPEPTRSITEWSSRSRSRMTRRLCELDYAPFYADPTRVPALLTLTYPADWLTVVPNGKVLKAHLKVFRKRFIRAWVEGMWSVWKLEFQRRGAPHIHFLMLPPHGNAGDVPRARHEAELAEWERAKAAGADPGMKPRFRAAEVGDGLNFKQWLSAAWADIVDHPDPEERRKHEAAGTNVDFAEGLRHTDPKRIAVYFTKHGTFAAKEYQNTVPEEWREPGMGPGRFWGYWGLDRAICAQEIEVPTYFEAARTLRRYAAAQGTTRRAKVWRTTGGIANSEYPEVQGLAGAAYAEERPKGRYRYARRRVQRFGHTSGFLSVNDGPGMASALHRALSAPPEEAWQDRRERLIAATGKTIR